LVNSRAKRAAVGLLVAMVAIHVVLFWTLRRQVREGYSDFASFYGAGRILHSGLHNKIYDYDTQWELQRNFAPGVVIRHGPLLYNHAPFEAWLFSVFGAFSYPTAYILWNLTNAAILIGIAWLMTDYFEGKGLGLLLLAFLAFFPVLLVFVQGQDSILLLLLYTLALRNLRSGHEFAAGALLALGLFKPQLVLPMALIFVFRGQIKVLAGFTASAGAMFAASLAAVGWKDTINYPRYVWTLSQQRSIGAITPANMPNLRGVLDGLVGSLGGGLLVAVLSVAIALGLTFAVARVWNRTGDNEIGFALATVVTVLLSYHLYAYDATLLLLPIMVAAGVLVRDSLPSRTRTMAIWSVGCLMFTPLWVALLFGARHLNVMALVIGFFAWILFSMGSKIGVNHATAAGAFSHRAHS